jgi:hypothetical protein
MCVIEKVACNSGIRASDGCVKSTAARALRLVINEVRDDGVDAEEWW